MTLFTENTVVAEPVVLESLFALFGAGKAVRMETFSAKIAPEEVLLQSECSTEVTHLLEDQGGVIIGNSDRIAVPT